MRRGDPVAPEEVAGALFRGWNGSRLTALVGARKFFKRFHEPDATGRVAGENVLARQNAIGSPWRPRRIGRAILPFTVLPPGAHAGAGWPHALVISYGDWPGRSRLNPVRRVVDYLVRPDATAPALLLGVSHLRLGHRRIFLEHFLLERVRVRPPPPSAA